MVLFEAMAADVPIVATMVGGVPDVVSEREALLVPSDDPDALATAIGRVLGFPDEATERAVRAARRLRSAYAVEPWLDAHVSLYRGLLGFPVEKEGRST
jgi:glycosyltransferase involved in cell wall biosynthesis